MSADPLAGPILLLLVLLLLCGLSAAAESALLSVSDAKLRHDAEEEDDAQARQALKLLEQPLRCRTALLIVMTLSSLVLAGFAVAAFVPRVTPALEGCALASVLSPHAVSMILVLGLLGLVLLVFGQSAPRRIAQQQPEKTLFMMLRALRVLTLLLSPLVWLVNLLSGLVMRAAGMNPHAGQDEVTAEEIRMMVDIGTESGAIEETEKEMIENIFEFNHRSAEDVMTHRIDVTSIWVGDDHDTIVKTILDTGLSRFPVYDEDIDDIVGILNTRDYLLDWHSKSPHPLRELLREAYFVPETVQADALFRDMQKRKVHMAVVVDEYGGMSGIVTMEDLLEEIVGNIYDEFDPQAETEIAPVGENQWRIAGSASLEDVSEALNIDLPLEEDYDTLGGLIFNQFTTIPADGSTPAVDVAGLHIQVELIADHRVERALVTRLTPPCEDDEEKSVPRDKARDKSDAAGKKDDNE